MPKQKTHKGLKKRVKVTATGKVKHKRAFGGHLMSGKNANRRRRIASPALMMPVLAKKVKIKLGLD
jgi:large subunit ribosomal protein L35